MKPKVEEQKKEEKKEEQKDEVSLKKEDSKESLVPSVEIADVVKVSPRPRAM